MLIEHAEHIKYVKDAGVNYMRLHIIVGILCIAFSAGAALAEDAPEGIVSEATLENEDSRSNIFLQEGASGTFIQDESGNYTLTISNVIPYTIYFSDRPGKDSGFVPLDKFIAGFNWDPANPPNAAIIIREGDEEEDAVIAQLTSPYYDETNQTLVYSCKVLSEYQARSERLQEMSQLADTSIPESFGPVLLVIDDCPCLWAPAQCGDHCSNSCCSTSWKTFPNFACVYDGACCSKCYFSPQ
jgi:hypothetical protein